MIESVELAATMYVHGPRRTHSTVTSSDVSYVGRRLVIATPQSASQDCTREMMAILQ